MVEHDEGTEMGQYEFHWMDQTTGRTFIEATGPCRDQKSLIQLFYRLWELANLEIPAITLSLRVREGTPLDDICQFLDQRYRMSEEICPSARFVVGIPAQAAAVDSNANDVVREARLPFGVDRRYYLIVGTPGALTMSHWDRGVQSVLYHTVAGTNHAIAVPRNLAIKLHAINEGLDHVMATSGDSEMIRSSEWAIRRAQLEADALKACEGAIQTGTFSAGETMLILPGGEHAVLTGDDGKVVLAGEWHLRTDRS